MILVTLTASTSTARVPGTFFASPPSSPKPPTTQSEESLQRPSQKKGTRYLQFSTQSPTVLHVMISLLLSCIFVVFTGCTKRTPDASHDTETTSTTEAPAPADDNLPAGPTVDEEAQKAAVTPDDPYDIPRFGSNSPFEISDDPSTLEEEKRLWANSIIWQKAPELIVEKWLTDAPDTAGKYVLIEFWATWCPPCRRSLTFLNTFHEKYKDELIVIGISDEPEADVRKLKDPQISFYSAIDTQARTKKELGVFGIPHVILLEPNGCVVWEGYPLLKNHELTEDIIEHILSIGRRLKSQQADR